jgi:YD repeat-containing protein
LTVSDSAGNALANTYDTAKRVVSVAQTFAGLSGARSLSYQYDAAGNKTRVTHPDGFYVQYAYDALNRMTTAPPGSRTGVRARAQVPNGATVLATTLYDPVSRRTSLVTGNGAAKGAGLRRLGRRRAEPASGSRP